jgi:hypothetical protein
MKVYVSEEIWDHLDSDWNIKLPEEFKTGNYDHDQAEIQRCDFKISGLRKGYFIGDEDFKKLSTILSMNDRTEDVLEINRIYKVQKNLPNLINLYNENSSLKEMVDSNNYDGVNDFLNTYYFENFGQISKEILERDTLYLFEEVNKQKNISKGIDSLLDK